VIRVNHLDTKSLLFKYNHFTKFVVDRAICVGIIRTIYTRLLGFLSLISL
jgi:hypothetical protein